MIRLLDDRVIDRIAAGEVVDRPASAVKELVDNALDAGARRVKVRLEGGGLDLIAVEDDGCGMVPEDLRMSWLRHATSKLEVFEDLERTGTYGFRGEALSSLAAVAELRLDSRHESLPEGRSVAILNGHLVTDAPSGWPRGTRVEVRGLFAGIPVRRRFLGSAQAEAQRVLGGLVKVALARPDVEFRLSHGGRELLGVLPAERRQRVRDLLGALADGMEPVEWSDGTISVTGFVGAPGTDRGRPDHVHFSVNRRPIQAGVLNRAVAKGLGLPAGRHPVCVLEISLPLEQVDINVHPQKREVRFQAESALFHAVADAIATSLDQRASLPLFFPQESPPEGAEAEPLPGFSLDALLLPPPPEPVAPENQGDLFAAQNPNLVAFPRQASAPHPDPEPRAEPARAFSQAGIQFLQVEGYLLAPLQGGLLCIDQRAAHERVLFEQALRGLDREGAVPSQQLLFPRPIELPVREHQTAVANLPRLRALSFDLEPFGGQALLLRGAPASVPQDEAESLLAELLSAVAEEEPTRERLHRAFAAGFARAAALRRDRDLSPEERSALADDLFACDEPWLTPGGTPTVTRVAASDLARFFR